MDYRFRVEILEEAKRFLDELDEKSNRKVMYNIWKSRSVIDKELFKKLEDEIWEFRTLYNRKYIRLFAFWDKTTKKETIVLATHGMIKKTAKIPKSEIDRAERIRMEYFKAKKK